MWGKIIEFRRYRDLKRAPLYRHQPVTRGPAGRPGLDQQIARISGLLGELEEWARDSEFPLETLPGESQENEEGDPQPEVDPGLLDRMYRALGDRGSVDGSSAATGTGPHDQS